ncbi:MAG: ROK family protein [Deltaproteobacteria bacterium]|jgi:glucokinase|nr:ROK family protein [Deltaproteobacteria bacterium]
MLSIRQNKDLSEEDTFLALDIGGTNVTCGLVNRLGEVLATDIFPTSQVGREDDPTILIAHIAERLKILWGTSDQAHRPTAVAIGAPGWIKPLEGIVVTAPNLKGWVDVPITRLMSQALELPARLENDANLYALGEWLAGAGKSCNNQITITLGTGVGAGLILNGQLWSGSFSSAAEIGHIPLGPAYTSKCGCGRPGCLETVASARGMARLAREWMKEGKKTKFKGEPETINTEIMMELAVKGDPMSIHVFKEAGTALGQVLAGVFNLLSLEMAVLGGGAAGAFKFIKQALIEYLAKHLVTAKVDEIQVVKGELGVTAPLVGAAAMLTAEGF